jgi:hypothetical protein
MAGNISNINIPRSAFLDTSSNRPTREWLLYLLGLGRTIFYGVFSDTVSQTAVANTPTAITLNTTELSNGVYLGSTTSQIICQSTGVYNFQFSIQFENTAASVSDVYVWIRKNGSNVANTASLVSIPAKHGGDNGHTIFSLNYVLSLNAFDYIQFYWSTSIATTSIQYYAAQTSPSIPAGPSIIVTVTQVNL